MSYHILHHFDEQLIADLTHEPSANRQDGVQDSFEDDDRRLRRARLVEGESKRWAVVAAAILLAAFALILSIDANRRAESLQHRIDALETRLRK